MSGEKESATVEPSELARDLGIDPKRLRHWLRATYGTTHEHRARWYLNDEQVRAAKAHFGARHGQLAERPGRRGVPGRDVHLQSPARLLTSEGTPETDPDAALDAFDRVGLAKAGFKGFFPFATVATSDIPTGPGVYALLRETPQAPAFRAVSTGGRFKGREPAVSLDVLSAAWCAGAQCVYLGKATSLRSRLSAYRRFGSGRPVGHWGGRYVWQLDDADDLVVAWLETDTDPREVERTLIARFVSIHGQRPFANLVG